MRSTSASMQSNSMNRRSRKSSRRYQCEMVNCGKAYSRLEHLRRHELNHTPKAIYRCDVPDCCCSFVRADLYTLHRNRHMSEYLQSSADQISQSNDQGNTFIPTLESLNSITNGISNHNIKAQSPIQDAVNLRQTNCEDSKRDSIHLFQTADPFLIREAATQVSTNSNHKIHDPNISQQHQKLEMEPWKNGIQSPFAMPYFDGDSYCRSSFAIPDDFIQFLFNENQFGSTTGEGNSEARVGSISNYPHIDDGVPNLMLEGLHDSCLPQPQLNIMAASYEASAHSKILTDKKSQEISDFVRYRLIGNEDCTTSGVNNNLLEGDRSDDLHLMSQNMMQQYIDSYWGNFHSHFPILHPPSFFPNEVPNILMISVMIIGASCFDESDDQVMPNSPVEISEVLAWHLRWEIFRTMHLESESLWMYQALLLLELYEKTYSSRSLHQRSHIHHATTITMMRRGNFMAGRSPLNTPLTYEQSQTSDRILTKTVADIWWEEWIRCEGTRRAAFAAFLIDSTHAAMFGHSMIMATHELRLVLPCDDALWSATSGDEIQRIEATLRSNRVTPIPFLEGLRRTLNGQDVRTNPFGRSILLCGVLSVSWHMNQRDIQISSLDITIHRQERGPKWRRSIARAFDLWRKSHSTSQQAPSDDTSKWWRNSDSVLCSRSALYYLAQFSLNVDIVECQIFAGANRVLGRAIGAHEVENVRRKIRNVWAPSVEARRATFYAIRFLCLLFRDTKRAQGNDRESVINFATSTSILPVQRWVLYSAALIVWSYTYAVDGPSIVKTSTGTSIDEQIQEMDSFLTRTKYIKSPEDVAFYRLSGCAGMLQVLCHIFRMGSWELLHEGADLLTNCIRLIER